MLNRLKQYIEHKGMTVASVEKALGMSNGALSKPINNHKAIGSDKLENILAFCPDLSLTWLFTGRGEMLNMDGYAPTLVSGENATRIENNLLKLMLGERDTTILQQAQEIGKLKEQIRQLKQRLEKTAGDVSTGDIANVG